MSEPQSIAPAPKRSRVVETEEYVAALARFIDGYGRRVGEDPAAIAYFHDLQQRLTDAVNVGVATAHKRKNGWSLREIGAIFGTSHVAVLKRVKAGLVIIANREAAAGVVHLKDAVKPSVPALRKQRAEWLEEKGVQDYRVREIGKHRKSA